MKYCFKKKEYNAFIELVLDNFEKEFSPKRNSFSKAHALIYLKSSIVSKGVFTFVFSMTGEN